MHGEKVLEQRAVGDLERDLRRRIFAAA